MKYAIELLKERLENLDSSYHDFVVNGSVDKNCKSAIDNRSKVIDCEKAIKILIQDEPIKCHCMYCEKELNNEEAIILCKQCTE